jgi:hypothetical protein
MRPPPMLKQQYQSQNQSFRKKARYMEILANL